MAKVVNGNRADYAPTQEDIVSLLSCLKVSVGESWIGRAGRLMHLKNKQDKDIGRREIHSMVTGRKQMPYPMYKGFEQIIKEEK